MAGDMPKVSSAPNAKWSAARRFLAKRGEFGGHGSTRVDWLYVSRGWKPPGWRWWWSTGGTCGHVPGRKTRPWPTASGGHPARGWTLRGRASLDPPNIRQLPGLKRLRADHLVGAASQVAEGCKQALEKHETSSSTMSHQRHGGRQRNSRSGGDLKGEATPGANAACARADSKKRKRTGVKESLRG